MPRNRFRQPGGPVRQIDYRTGSPGWESITGLLKMFTNAGSGTTTLFLLSSQPPIDCESRWSRTQASCDLQAGVLPDPPAAQAWKMAKAEAVPPKTPNRNGSTRTQTTFWRQGSGYERNKQVMGLSEENRQIGYVCKKTWNLIDMVVAT